MKTFILKDNAGVIVNPKGEMKGSAITGPVAKECVCVTLVYFDARVTILILCSFRRIYGRVLRQTLALSSDFTIHAFVCVRYCVHNPYCILSTKLLWFISHEYESPFQEQPNLCAVPRHCECDERFGYAVRGTVSDGGLG